MKNISRLLILSCLSLSCAMMSCDKDEDGHSKDLPTVTCGEGLIPFDSEQYNTLPTDSSSVMDVRIEQTCLIVDFAYSGCAERDIDVMAYLDQSSFIPILHAKISNGPLESCTAFFAHTDTFDLSSTQLDIYDGVILKIHQWEESFVLDLD